MRARVLAAVAAVVVAAGAIGSAAVVGAVAESDPATASCTSTPAVVETEAGSTISVECTVPRPPPVTETVTVPGPTATVTLTPTPSSTPSTSTPPSATTSTTPSTTPTSTPTATPTTPPPSTGFPNASNTGPTGTLTAYTGPCTLPAGTTLTIDSKNVSAKCGELIANQDRTTLTIRNSLLPRVEMTDPDTASSLAISDSEVRAPGYYEGAVWGGNLTLTRVEVTGGQHSVHCQSNCTVTDSWLHAQYNDPAKSFHTNAFITNGGHGIVLKHNTLHCDSTLNANDGGCTADVSLFGDFEKVYDVLVEGNYLRANGSSISYCAYGGYQPTKRYPVATQIRYVDNVFERGSNRKCGVYGPVTSFQASATGNVWSGNRYDDGVVIDP